MFDTTLLIAASIVIAVLYHRVKQWDDRHVQPSYRRR